MAKPGSTKAAASTDVLVSENKKARFQYEILDRVEAGISLTGSEVKSLRAGQASLDEAYARIRDGEVYLIGANISPYPMAGYAQHVPKRERKLLLHRRQIKKWEGKVTLKGFTLVALGLHFNERGMVKLDLALARGKTHGDKRLDLKAKDQKREMDRAMRRK